MRNFSELYGRFLDTSGVSLKKMNIAYGNYSANKLDIYYPEEGEHPFPVIVFFHGGGFFKGDKARYQLKPALEGIDRGYAVVSVEYRLAPEYLLPAAFDDAMEAMRFLFTHGKQYDLDTQCISVWGESVGAMLACVTGFSFPIQAIIDWYAPVDLRNIRNLDIQNESLVSYLFGKNMRLATLECDRWNLLNLVHKGVPPILIEHGTADEFVPVQDSVDLHQMLTQFLEPDKNQLYIIPEGRHGVEDYQTEENLNQIYSFLENQMKRL